MDFNSKEHRQWANKTKSPYELDKNYPEIQDDLNPCPMCGAKPHLIFPFRNKYNVNQSKIKCSNCGTYTIADTMYRAISDWNSKYVIEKEDTPIDIFQYDINYLNEDSMNYFLTHTLVGHYINGDTIYAIR